MKKSLLLVGAFLTVAAMAQAKEVVPAPVVVTEAPVQIVEKEVIVYRDRAPVGFRPNGYVDLQYRWYGETENQTSAENDWAGATKYGRTQLMGKINMTENQSFEYRIRNYGNDSSDRLGKSGTDTRLRYFYNHGNVGDSNVNFTSRIHYRDREDTDKHQELEYQARFNFAEYMFNDEYITKPFNNKILLARIKTLIKNTSNNTDHIIELGKIAINDTSHTVTVEGEEIILAPKEYELLIYLIKNHKIALSRDKMLTEVWGYDFPGSDRTIDTHIKNLRKKLGDECIKTVRGIGYKFEIKN